MRKALTIGELLVTMTIIGVIAALVLPGFLKDYHKRIYTTKLKKTYEILENAINQACNDNNVSYIGQTKYGISSKANQQEFLDKYFKITATKTQPFAKQYKILNTGVLSNYGLASSHGWAKLVSGEAVSYYCAGGTTTFCVFRVDVNSTDGPNIGGRDFFILYIDLKTNKIYDGKAPEDCGTEYSGGGCFGRILKNNWEMDY